MRDYINKLAKYIMEDIEAVRKCEQKPDERLGIEVMALNALCNADSRLRADEKRRDNGKNEKS